MQFKEPLTLAEVANFLSCEFIGDPNHQITGINEIHMVSEVDIVFVDHSKYYDKALFSKATTIIIDKEVECPDGKGLLVTSKPFDAFNKITKFYSPYSYSTKEIATNTNIATTAIISANVIIGNNVTIGENTIIHPGVVIYDNCVIGDNVIIHANVVLGGDAFYYKKKETGYDRLHTCGRVIIKNNAEIGAACTIDRGVSGDTTIGEGTKIDNHVHIGHDCIIGKSCLFAAQVGIAGCVIIKDNVTIWGQVGIASDVTIGENVIILAQSGISKDLEPNKTYFGSPAGEVRAKFKEMAALKKLPFILEHL